MPDHMKHQQQAPTVKTDRRRIIFPIVIAFAAGFICGAAAAVYKLSPAQVSPHVEESRMAGMAQALEAEAAKHPDNLQVWMQLGNLYFDNDQAEKAIGAYEKALVLDPKNADLLTDLGVMYRRAGQLDRAVSSFDRAIAVNPSHETARFNKGVVLMNDMKDTKGAIAVWKELAEINPLFTAPGGQSLDELMRHYEEHVIEK